MRGREFLNFKVPSIAMGQFGTRGRRGAGGGGGGGGEARAVT